jgi:hypothetical protein
MDSQTQLIAMLGSQSAAEQEQACRALQSLAEDSQADKLVCMDALIAPMVGLLQSPSADVQSAAAAALAATVEGDPDCQSEVVEAGALPLLAEQLNSPSPSVQQQACWALRALAQSQTWRMPAATVEALAGLLQHPSAPVQEAAVTAVAEVAAACAVSNTASEAKSAATRALPLLLTALDLLAAAVQQQACEPLLRALAVLRERERARAAYLDGEWDPAWDVRSWDLDRAAAGFAVQMARSQAARLQESAAGAVAALTWSTSGSNREHAVAAGAPSLLLELLTSPSPALHSHAARGLGALAYYSDECAYAALVSAGAAEALAGLLRSALSDDLKQEAAYALYRIAARKISGGQEAVVAAQAVPLLLDMVGPQSSSRTQRAATRALEAIMAGNAACQGELLAGGVVQRLAQLLDRTADSQQEGVASALAALAADSTDVKAAVAATGAFEQLARQLTTSEDVWQAVHSLGTLAAGNEEGQARAVAAGAVEALVPLLDVSLLKGACSIEWSIPGSAARALGSIVAGSAKGQARAVAAGAVPLLLRLLQAEEANDAEQESVLAALAALAGSCEAAQLRPAVPLLVAMLGDKSWGEQEQASRALGAMAQRFPACAAELQAAIGPLVGVLLQPLPYWYQELGMLSAAAGALCAIASSCADSKERALAAGAAPALVTHLDSPSAAVQEQACMALRALADGNAVGEQALVAATVPLLGLLWESSAGVQRAAAEAFSAAAACANAHAEVVPAGTAELLKRLLAAHLARVQPGSALQELAASRVAHLAEAAAAEIQLLVRLLASASASVHQQACMALGSIANRDASCELDLASAVAPLVALMRSPLGDVQRAAAAALAAVACCDPATTKPVPEAGQVHARTAASRAAGKEVARRDVSMPADLTPLWLMLDSGTFTEEGAAAAWNFLGALAAGRGSEVDEVCAVPDLVDLLDTQSPAAQEQACRALRCIAADNAEARAEMLAEGATEAFSRLLHAPSAVARSEAAAALGAVAFECCEAQDVILAAGAVPVLAGLLHGPPAAVQAQALLTLFILAHGNTECREQFLQSGKAAVLQSLQAADSALLRELGTQVSLLLER